MDFRNGLIHPIIYPKRANDTQKKIPNCAINIGITYLEKKMERKN